MQGALPIAFAPKSNAFLRRRRPFQAVVLPLITIVTVVLLVRQWFLQPDRRQPLGRLGYPMPNPNTLPRIAKVTALYGPSNGLYEDALKTHDEHNRKWGYESRVLRKEFTDGYWNKYAYLLSIVLQELQKPEGERLEWLFWNDPSTLLLNPNIPLSVFLPPADLPSRPDRDFDDRNDDPTIIHLLGAKWPALPSTPNQEAPVTSSFFLRVHPWAIRFLTELMTAPVYLDEVSRAENPDAQAFNQLARDDTFRGNTIFVPWHWFAGHAVRRKSARTKDSDKDKDSKGSLDYDFEAPRGTLSIHFSGLMGDRWAVMARWLAKVAPHSPFVLAGTPGAGANEHAVSLKQTGLVDETGRFWSRVAAAKATQYRAENHFWFRDVSHDFMQALYRLRDALELRPYEGAGLDRAAAEMKKAIEELD